MLQSADGVRGPPTGSNSHHHIVLAGFAPGHIFASAGAGILTVFIGSTQSPIASCDYILNGVGVRVEGGRTLGGIERSPPPAGDCTYVNQPSTAANRIRNGLNGHCDLG